MAAESQPWSQHSLARWGFNEAAAKWPRKAAIEGRRAEPILLLQ
jgi:hypothetical protein